MDSRLRDESDVPRRRWQKVSRASENENSAILHQVCSNHYRNQRRPCALAMYCTAKNLRDSVYGSICGDRRTARKEKPTEDDSTVTIMPRKWFTRVRSVSMKEATMVAAGGFRIWLTGIESGEIFPSLVHAQKQSDHHCAEHSASLATCACLLSCIPV